MIEAEKAEYITEVKVEFELYNANVEHYQEDMIVPQHPQGSGQYFDPLVVDAFLAVQDDILNNKEQYSD